MKLDQLEAKSDMTPMIDVVFLMIIFFLCIEFRVLEAKLPAFMPRDRGTSTLVAPPVEQLSVQVLQVAEGVKRYDSDRARKRYRLEGHRVRWRVGPVEVHSTEDLEQELRRVAASPQSRILDPETGDRELMACVVEPDRGVRYADVTQTTDLLHATGFDKIHFSAGRR